MNHYTDFNSEHPENCPKCGADEFKERNQMEYGCGSYFAWRTTDSYTNSVLEFHPGRQCLIKQVNQLETELAAIREQARWIPVGERLPEDNVKVLVAAEDCSVKIAWHTTDKYSVGWETWFGSLGLVHHWRPLPEGPKEDLK